MVPRVPACPLLLLLLLLLLAVRARARATQDITQKRATATLQGQQAWPVTVLEHKADGTVDGKTISLGGGDQSGEEPRSQGSLTLSTVMLCPPATHCIPCVRVHVHLASAVPVEIQRLRLHFLEYRTNRNAEVQLLLAQVISTADFEYECFESEAGAWVEVTVTTISASRQGHLELRERYMLEDTEAGPEFNYSLDLERRQIVVSVSPDREVNAVLCYKLALACHDLPNRSHVLIGALAWRVPLSYDYLIPCLCIEVFSSTYDSVRTQLCPFKRDPEAYGADLWRSSAFSSFLSEPDTMKIRFSSECRIVPRVSLCWVSDHTAAACQQIANSTIESPNNFEYKNSSHVECRNQADRDWNVTLVTESDSFLIVFSSHIPANFSVFLCKPTGTGCEPYGPVYTAIQTEHSSSPQLSLPVPSLQLCVMVQRSDVLFAGTQRVCGPQSEGRLGLGLMALLVGLVCGLLVVSLVRHFTRKVDSAPLWSRTVLLMYLPGCEEHTSLVCGLADVLKSEVQCNVLLDLWDCGAVARLGVVAWLYSRREQVMAENGKILIVWSQRSHGLYLQWAGPVRGHSHTDPHDLFHTAMACVYSDFLRCGKLRDYSLVYFDGLCSNRDIPDLFYHVPRYRLLKDFSSLVHELRNVPERPRGSVFGTKRLVRVVLQSESARSLRRRIERCRRGGRRDSLCPAGNLASGGETAL